MKIVFVSIMELTPWGGSEELWSQAAVRLREAGHEVAASVHHWAQLSPKIEELRTRGIQIHPRTPPSRNMVGRILRKVVRRRTDVPSSLRYVLDSKPALVVFSLGGNIGGAAWMKYCEELGLPYVVIIQANTEAWWPADWDADAYRSAYESARTVYAVSHQNLDLLKRQFILNLPNAKVVRNPYRASTGAPPDWPSDTGVVRLACVGRLDPKDKGQDLLLQVLAQPEWKSRAVEVNFYGAGSAQEGLRKLAGQMGLTQVQFHGHVAGVREIWEKNHMLVLPSRCEGLPLALVEAMWCARPCIVTDVGGNAELCVDGNTGFMVPAPSVALLAETMERAWAKRDQWAAMGAAARHWVEETITRDPVGDFCQDLLIVAPPAQKT